MGQRGPKGKPPEMKLLQGNRGHRPLVTDGMLRPLVEVPSVPKHLGREARKEWKRITVELVRYNVISRLDQQMLGMLCQAVERMVMFETALQRRVEKIVLDNAGGEKKYVDPATAFVTTTAQGYPMQCVEYQLLNKEREMVMKLLAEFGLSPAMRARVVPGMPASTQLTLFAGGKGTQEKDGPQSFSEF